VAAVSATDSVFINCPFDSTYWPLLEVIVFTVLACGFIPRAALEESDGSDIRLEKILRLIQSSRYGIHDISCVALDQVNNLPRFNMPFELGIDLACKRYGTGEFKRKRILILEETQFLYQKCLSDIAGQDTQAHEGDPAKLLRAVRSWLRTASARNTIPGDMAIQRQFEDFSIALPDLCTNSGLDRHRLAYVEYIAFARTWLEEASA
jgi:hypothetical protein